MTASVLPQLLGLPWVPYDTNLVLKLCFLLKLLHFIFNNILKCTSRPMLGTSLVWIKGVFFLLIESSFLQSKRSVSRSTKQIAKPLVNNGHRNNVQNHRMSKSKIKKDHLKYFFLQPLLTCFLLQHRLFHKPKAGITRATRRLKAKATAAAAEEL